MYEVQNVISTDLLKVMQQFEPNIPIPLSRLSEFTRESPQITEMRIKTIINQEPELGRFLELEKVFIREDGTGAMIDQLIDEQIHFQEESKVGKLDS
jgi:hypothetical protein